jgi:hypothetical protein
MARGHWGIMTAKMTSPIQPSSRSVRTRARESACSYNGVGLRLETLQPLGAVDVGGHKFRLVPVALAMLTRAYA